jgi:hypothetical protein
MPSATRRVLLLAIAGGVLFDVLVIGNAAGVNAPIVMAAFLACALLVAGREGVRGMDPWDAWLAPAALAFAGLAVIRADDWLVTFDLLFAAALAAGTVGCLAGGRITRGLVPRVLDLGIGVVAAGAAGTAGLLLRPSDRSEPEAEPAAARSGRLARLRNAAPVVRGLVIAVPIVLVFGALFASADAVFARLANDVLEWQPDLDLGELAERAIVVSVIAWGSAGLLALAAGLLPTLRAPFTGQSDAAGSGPLWGPATSRAEPAAGAAAATAVAGSAAGAPPAPPEARPWPGAAGGPWPSTGLPAGATAAASTAAWPAAAGARAQPVPLRLGAIEAATVLVVVDLLFAVFVVLQLAYLFGGRDTLSLAGLTYAEYARRGFFELVLVALLAGMLVVTLDTIAAKRSRLLLGASLALLGLTAVVLLSALLRLRLYQEAYGWTELRFVVLTAILWLGVAIAIAAVLLTTARTRWILHALGIAVLVTVAGMNVMGPQAFVAQRNLDRAIDPSLVPPGGRTGLDARYLSELGDEAIEPIVDAWSVLPIADRAALTPVLRRRDDELANDPALQGWPAWNLTRERAREALDRWGAAGN